jgi:hypothetical protein
MAPQLASAITKQRIRAPRKHGQKLILPDLPSISKVWTENKKSLRQHQFQIGGYDIQQLRQQAKFHLLETAKQYTSQYCDLAVSDDDGIIISGHQPRLFHSGVWFKNFVLSSLGKSLQATAINLIVDNDLCGLSNVSVPQLISATEASTTSIAYDAPGGNLPFESRKIADPQVFDSFAARLGKSISGTVSKPLVHQLWRNVRVYRDPQQRLGHTLAAARHQLETQAGLSTLEVPLSWVCQSTEFAIFSAELLERVDEFRSTYNQSLAEYRAVHRIRSSSHPVPELATQGEWFETPFWIWSADNQVRRALYVRQSGRQLCLSNRGDIHLTLDSSNLPDQLHGLTKQQIAIRPRALITTMYSRLLLSDLFLHGIGGSKYDQLTDAIITKFWQCAPPKFLTATATMKLPFEFERVTEQDIMRANQEIRDLKFHPEKHIDNPSPQTAKLIQAKADWIDDYQTSKSNKKRHDAISQCNEKLQPLVAEKANRIRAEQLQKKSLLARSRILDARGYSFCCFDEELISKLSALAANDR